MRLLSAHACGVEVNERRSANGTGREQWV